MIVANFATINLSLVLINGKVVDYGSTLSGNNVKNFDTIIAVVDKVVEC